MSIFDIPTKIVESTENLLEKKFELTVHLLNIYYREHKRPEHLPELLENYNIIFKHLKSLTPKPQTNFYVKHFKILIISFFVVVSIFIITIGLLLYKFGFREIIDNIIKFFQ